MISVYLNLNGNAREAAHYYARVLDAPEPDIMTPSQAPADDEGMAALPADFVIHANVTTFAGNLMLSDNFPGQSAEPSEALSITLSHSDHALLARAFDNLAKDGRVDMPLAPTFFSSLFGSLRDKYGFMWLIMSDE